MTPCEDDILEALNGYCRAGSINGVLSSIKSLTKVDEVITDGSWTALSIAAYVGHADVCVILLEHGADPNLMTKDGSRPLALAAAQGHLKVCSVLIAFGARVDLASQSGCTPLTVAARQGHLSTCQELVSRGANTSLPDSSNGWSALMNSAYSQNADPDEDFSVEIATLLLDNGAQINYQVPDSGWTALMNSAVRGDIAQCVLLLERGANVHLMDARGRTALEWAIEKKNEDIVVLLQSEPESLQRHKLRLLQQQVDTVSSDLESTRFENSMQLRIWTDFEEVSAYVRECAVREEREHTIRAYKHGWIVPNYYVMRNLVQVDGYTDEAVREYFIREKSGDFGHDLGWE